MDDGIFTIEARKCKRCGRLLFSREALERGYGCLCERKARADGTFGKETQDENLPGQMSLLDYFNTESEETTDGKNEN